MSDDTFNPTTATPNEAAAELPETPAAAPGPAAPEPGPETAAKPEGEGEKTPDAWAQRFEKLSTLDAETRARQKAIEERERELERWSSLAAKAKENPLDVVKELGLTPDDILKHQLNGGKPDLYEKFEALEKRNQELERKLQQVDESIELRRKGDEWEQSFKQVLESDDYKIVRDWDGAADAVRHRVAAHFRENKELLPPKQELDKIKSEILSRLEKVKSYITPSQASGTATQPQASSPKRQNSGPKTLTPELGSATARFNPLDDDEAEMARIAAKYSS